MRALLLCLALVAAAPHALAQADAAGESERARIAAERKQAEARLSAQEVACYKAFSVNDCLRAARAERRERLADLRRQELSLNDAERRRRSAERLRSIEERRAAQEEEGKAARRSEAVAQQKERQEAQARRAAGKPVAAASAARRPAKTPAVRDTAQELRRSQERQQDAKERRERVARRQAEAARSGVKPLPVPP